MRWRIGEEIRLQRGERSKEGGEGLWTVDVEMLKGGMDEGIC